MDSGCDGLAGGPSDESQARSQMEQMEAWELLGAWELAGEHPSKSPVQQQPADKALSALAAMVPRRGCGAGRERRAAGIAAKDWKRTPET